MSCQQGLEMINSLLERSGRVELGLRSLPKRPLSSFHQPYLGKTWRRPLCEWEQLSALSLHSPRSRKIQYLAYLRDQNLALWERSHGRGTQRAQGRGAAACWPIGTPAPGCEMGYHARSGWWTENKKKTDQEESPKVLKTICPEIIQANGRLWFLKGPAGDIEQRL